MFIDTHCHILKEYYDDISNVISESKEKKVEYLISCGCEKKDIKESLELAKKFPNLYLSIGYHPDAIDDYDLDYLKENLTNEKVVALGEIGLDYHYIETEEEKEKQKELFEKQLVIAEEFNMPVVIHSREATKDTMERLKKYNLKGVIHCFSGSYETAIEYIKMEYKLGIGGVVTFKNSKLKKVIRKISLDDIVLETDSPYLCPDPYRGKENSPKYIPVIAGKIAEIKEISVDEVMNKTTENALKLFPKIKL